MDETPTDLTELDHYTDDDLINALAARSQAAIIVVANAIDGNHGTARYGCIEGNILLLGGLVRYVNRKMEDLEFISDCDDEPLPDEDQD